MLNGSITLSEGSRASRVHVGRRYISDIETLDVETPEGTVQGKKVRVPGVTVRFKKSRLPLVGPNENKLMQMRQREKELMGSPTALLTGDKHVNIKPDWESNGRIFIRQIEPLPITVLAIIPDIQMEDLGDVE